MDSTVEKCVNIFKQQYESLAGVVHLAKNQDEVLETLRRILKEENTDLVSTADLPAEILTAFKDQSAKNGIEILEPPYQRDTLPQRIDDAKVGVSKVEFAIADTGSIVEFSTNDAVRLVSTLPDTHIALVDAKDIVETLEDAAPRIKKFLQANGEGATVTTISGPSRSGDIEMRLTLGVHGPIASHVIVGNVGM